jgi:hypothetical protein
MLNPFYQNKRIEITCAHAIAATCTLLGISHNYPRSFISIHHFKHPMMAFLQTFSASGTIAVDNLYNLVFVAFPYKRLSHKGKQK